MTYYTDKIEQALEFVRVYFPEVTTVYYDASGCWAFMDENGIAIDFGDCPIDYDLLEQSVDQAFADRGLPSTYSINNI